MICRLAGVLDALCVHRCVQFSVWDPEILVRWCCLQEQMVDVGLRIWLALQKLTGQCFCLNGLIYLGRWVPLHALPSAESPVSSPRTRMRSILGWTHLLQPFLRWLLSISMGPFVSSGAVDLSLSCLSCLYTALWLAPVYLVSFFMSCRWCVHAITALSHPASVC